MLPCRLRRNGLLLSETIVPAEKRAGWLRLSLVLAVVLILLLSARQWLDRETLAHALSRVQSLGNWGAVILSLFYILACVLFLPGSILTLAAGFLFGIVKGYVVVAVGSVLGAAAAFWIGRTVGREWVRRKVEDNAKFAAIDRAVAQRGFKIVLLTRLSPAFPFNLLNFAYGVTGVTFRDYFWASALGMAPGTVMYVYIGSAMKNLAEVFSGSTAPSALQNVIYALGLAATIAVTVLITKIARRALNEAAGLAAK